MPSILEIAANYIDPPGDDWEPLPHQIPPPFPWFVWLLLGGRGTGKTAAAAKHLHDHIMGPPCIPNVPGGHWPSIIAPTLGDGVTSCVNGPSGLRAHCPEVKVRTTAGGTVARYPNGCEIKIFGAHTPEDVERLRSGGNRCIAWAEELAAWRYMDDCWAHMRYGLRLGIRPHVVVSTTPKPRKLIKELMKRKDVRVTKGSTKDNPHLNEDVKKALFEDYGGTRLGRQELEAEILDDAENALWKYETLDKWRIAPLYIPEQLDYIGVGVDPAMKVDRDEHGIVVAGYTGPWGFQHSSHNVKDMSHGFVLGDFSLHGNPKQWATRVIDAFYQWEANFVVVEVNQGGDLVKANIQSLDATIPIREVTATRGKARRAEPIANLYEQGRVHHVGTFEALEDQMTSFDPVEPDESWSPDRMDALVWVLSRLMVKDREVRATRYTDNRLKGRR